jgi:hypothetical protein
MSKLQIFSMKPQQLTLENGNVVYIRRLSAGERLEWFDYLDTLRDEGEQKITLALSLKNQLKLLALALGDENGNRTFLDTEIDSLANIDSKTVDYLAHEIMVINGMISEATDEAKKK